MKNLNLLVWLTQLGISVALPPAIFIWLGVWLQDRFSWGNWVVIAAVIVGVICAVDGLRNSLKAMERMTKDRDKKKEDDPVFFNDHH